MGIICKDMKNIFVIQGDSLQRRYTFYDKDKNIITNQRLNSVLFSCKRLNYEQFLTYDDGAWVLTLTSEITSNFKQCRTSYDLTLYFESEQVSTQVYRAEFNVLKKDMIEDVEVSGEGESVDLDDIDVRVDTNINIIVSGSKNHDELEHRDFDDQHPMSAITGLEDALQSLDNDKQDNINDLNFIRDGANKGNTAVQPSQLSVYRTSALQDEIDNDIQSQIDALAASSDVVDIVGTHAELLAYDTQDIHDNDIIKVIADETHAGAPSYYRWVISGSVGTWHYVGSESVSYTKAETDALLNQKQSTIADLATIRNGASLGATAVQPEAGKGLFSGSYNDLTDKPTIPAAITEYLKSASVSGNTLNLVKNDGTTLPFTPQGGGGGNTSLELINEITLDESSSAIRIDKDVNSNAFTLNRAILFIFLPTTNDGADHNFYFQSTTYPYISFGGISGGKTTIVIEAEKNGLIRATKYQYGRDFNAQRIAPSAATGNDGKMPGDITMVRTANFSGNVFPVGTVFKLMGVRA